MYKQVSYIYACHRNMLKFLILQPILIHELKASKGSAENVEYGTDSNRVLKVQDKKQIISLLAPTVNECNLWLKRLEEAQENYEKAIALLKPAPFSSELILYMLLFYVISLFCFYFVRIVMTNMYNSFQKNLCRSQSTKL